MFIKIFGLFLLASFCNKIQSDTKTIKKTVQDEESQLQAFTVPTDIKSSYPVDLSFIIADIKYDNQSGQLKICEFGEGTRSYFQGHERLFGAGKMWTRLWDHLTTYKLPVWYIGRNPTNNDIKEVNYKYFVELGGLQQQALGNLYQDPLFKELQKKSIGNKNKISSYQGIIVLRHHKETNATINAFRNKNPNFIVLNSASRHYVNSKLFTSQLFADDDLLKHFKPHWNMYPKKYNAKFAQNICDDFPGKLLVLKPLDAANGCGVIMVHKNNLIQTLETIFKKERKLSTTNDDSFNYWMHDPNKQFIVEEYAPSHPLNIKEKLYDATMRMVFVLAYEQDTITITFLGNYWKLPILALSDEGTLIQKHKSKVGYKNISSTKVSLEDRTKVKEILATIMPKLYEKMLMKYKIKQITQQ